MQIIHGLHFKNIKGDIYGGLTAAVVALPLALAFGVASGAGAAAGLYGAIFVGFFAAMFGGTAVQISGPTGPMTVVMASILTHYAQDPALAFTIVMMSGVLQIIFGALKLGRLVEHIPHEVVSGFMTGIGVIIIVLEIAPFLGLSSAGSIVHTLQQLPDLLGAANIKAVVLGAATVGLVFLFPKRWRAIVPAELLSIVLGTSIVALFMVDVPVIGHIPTGFPKVQPIYINPALFFEMFLSAISLALLGTIDSLLTSIVADRATHSRHHPNRELIGQGIGNMVAGLFGGIAGAGATMRTMVNVKAGGGTPLAGMLHAVILLGLLLGFGFLAEQIPHAVLAGLLFTVGIDIMDWDYLKKMGRHSKKSIFVMVLVLVLTVLVDLITAVGVGFLVGRLLRLKPRMA